MKRPPRPTTRVASSPGWAVQRRRHRGRDPRATLATPPLTPSLLGIEPDPELEEQIAQLQRLELENLHQGADVRREAFSIAGRPELRLRLEQGEEIEEKMPCHVRLRKKRRRGILRYLLVEPVFPALPFFLPLLPPTPKGHEWRGLRLDLHLGRLEDELEHVWNPIFYTSYGWRPTANIMNSIQMRAVLGINAFTFYELNRQGRIPGRLSRGLPGSRYDTETVMRWVFLRGHEALDVPMALD